MRVERSPHRPSEGAEPRWDSAFDARAPWNTPWRAAAGPLIDALCAGSTLPTALDAAAQRAGLPVRFVPQQHLPPDLAYESYIFQSKQVPVRAGLHDFFNGICWLGMPQTKLRMNALQAAEITAHGVGGTRGPVRDAITLLDENGAFLCAPDALWAALVAHDWRTAFGALRPLWAQARLLVFGHAALEKLVRPYKSITVHVWRVPEPWRDLPTLDARVAVDLTPERLAAKPFTPLPVLGVPGWWAANEAPAFYGDTEVFRPSRHPAAAGFKAASPATAPACPTPPPHRWAPSGSADNPAGWSHRPPA